MYSGTPNHLLVTTVSVMAALLEVFGVQASPDMHETSTNTEERPEITIEDINDSDDKIMIYTGLPTFFFLFFCF